MREKRKTPKEIDELFMMNKWILIRLFNIYIYFRIFDHTSTTKKKKNIIEFSQRGQAISFQGEKHNKL